MNIKQIKTSNVEYGYFGKLRENKVIFLGINNSIDSMSIYVKNLEATSGERRLLGQTYSPPIGWINSNEFLLLKEDQLCVYNLDINDCKTLIKDSSINFSEGIMVNDEETLIYSPSYFQDKNLKSFKYNILTGKKELIKELLGKEITNLAYNKRHNIIAFRWYNTKDKLSYISVLESEKLIKVMKLEEYIPSDESPLALSEDGKKLFFFSKSKGVLILNEFDLKREEMTELYRFDKNSSCSSLSYSDEQLLISLDGFNSKKIKQVSHDSKYKYNTTFEVGMKMFIMSIPSSTKP